jgi:CRP-like cAMP-binding protein
MQQVFYHLEAGDTFGQLALEKDEQKRFAGAWCTKKATCLVIKRDLFLKFKEGIALRISSLKINFMKSIPLLEDLTSSKLKSLEPQFIKESKKIHQYLYHENDPANFVYLVQVGSFKVTKRICRPNLNQ